MLAATPVYLQVCCNTCVFTCLLQHLCLSMLAATAMYLHVSCYLSSALHLLVQSQSSKVQESEEHQQAKQTASEAEAVLA